MAIAKGKHLFPFRTEKLSLSAPMVLGPKGPGRVGRRRLITTKGPSARAALSSFRGRIAECSCDGSDRRRHTRHMSVVWIVVILLLVLVVFFFAGGMIGARRRAAEFEPELRERIAAADRALEAARAADRGWDPVLLEEAARAALERERPDFRYDRLHLVLVDDQPGTDADRCELAAVGDA